MNIQEELIKILKEMVRDLDMDDKALLNAKYLDTGLIDSLQLAEFITKIEEIFEIELEPEDIESTTFRTLAGVAEIIIKRKNETKLQ